MTNQQTLKKIDTYYPKNRKRHLATINDVQIPYEGRFLHGEVAVTVCGRVLRHFHSGVENYSYFCTDGSRYSTPCSICLPNDDEKEKEDEK